MRGTARHVMAFVLICASACSTGNTSVDPGDLELRDLLGVAPELASSWSTEQRASARRVLDDALAATDAPTKLELAASASIDERVTRAVAQLDTQRFAAGNDALALVRVELTPGEPLAVDAESWDALTPEAHDMLATVAADAGHRDGALVIARAPRLAVIAAYVATEPPRLLVNPVLVAALDPAFVDTGTAARRVTSASAAAPAAPLAKPPAVAGGNPYSFYGSVAECAWAQRLRCESCLASNNCAPVTTSTDGNAECNTLAANDGRGYFLLCINMSLVIASVESCAADTVSGCARDTDAASDLGQLDANANFLDDASCATGLDTCLAKIYGDPSTTFPGIVDGGMPQPPPDPPRDTDISCGDSCSDNNSNCEAGPSCSCDGPSCNNSFSCDSTCSSSNNQSGCGDNCDSCSSDDDTTTSSGGGCGGDSGGSSSDSSCGSCSGDSGGTSSGGSCGSCSGDGGGTSSGGGCGGDGGGGDCGGDCGGGGGDCGGGGGGSCGGSGGCQVVKKTPSAGFALALSLVWGAMPIPVAAFVKRRQRRRARKNAVSNEQEVAQ